MSLWDLYFMQVASWLLHPGYQREGTKVPSLEDIADMVDAMMEVRNKRGVVWQDGQQQQP